MNRLFLIENMTLQLMNQYVQIAKASVSSTLYTGEVKSAKMEVICHDGSGYMNGVCGQLIIKCACLVTRCIGILVNKSQYVGV